MKTTGYGSALRRWWQPQPRFAVSTSSGNRPKVWSIRTFKWRICFTLNFSGKCVLLTPYNCCMYQLLWKITFSFVGLPLYFLLSPVCSPLHLKLLFNKYYYVEIFYYQLMHVMLKNTELLKHSKITLQHVSVYIETIFREPQSALG